MDRQIIRRLAAVSNFDSSYEDELFHAAASDFRMGPGQLLLLEGEMDSAFLILVEGEVEILVGDPPVLVAVAKPGEMLGELSVFGEPTVRRATARTRTDILAVVISREGIAQLRDAQSIALTRLEAQAVHAVCARLRAMNERISTLAEGTTLQSAPAAGLLDRLRSFMGWRRAPVRTPAPDPRDVLSNSAMFGHLPDTMLASLARDVEMVSVPDGEVILAQGSFGRDAFIVGSGKVGVYRAVVNFEDERVAELGPGQMFGMVGMIHGSSRTATCIAEEPTWLLRVKEETFSTHASGNLDGAHALRRAAYEALAGQLAQANATVAALLRALANDKDLGEEERAAYRRLISNSV